MAINFDPTARRIILDSDSHSASEIWSRWVDWFVQSDNSKYPPAFRQVGGDELGGGLFVPVYFFLTNGWRVRPREASHTLVIDGNLFVEGGGVPVVPTLGSFNVSVQYTVPVQAQGIATSGSSGPSAAQVAEAVWGRVLEDLTAEQILRIALAALSGRSTGIGSNVENYLSRDGSKSRITATFDAQGNRTSVALDGS